MGEHTVRLLGDDELAASSKLVGRQMLGSITDEVAEGWADVFRAQGQVGHGAFTDGELVGNAAWFPTELAYVGEPLPAAAVTAVAVLSNHRRRGHLSRLMDAQLRHAADAGCAVAVLIAAEYPIYGRFGYGFATHATTLRLDTGAARFLDPPTGTITLADAAELRQPLQAAYRARWARTLGAITRVDVLWDRYAGLTPWPNAPLDAGQQRGAIWHDDTGQLGGAVRYTVEEHWTDHRPTGKVRVDQLWGATPEAERELWRHLTTVDWCRTAIASNRAVDDPLGLWLVDGRAAVTEELADNLWLRVLDVPATFAARRAPLPVGAVLDVVDDAGYAAGRWAVEVGPDGGSATATTAPPDVTLDAAALGAALLGGHTIGRLAAAGRVTGTPEGVARAEALLRTPTAPWSPLGF